MQQLAPFEVSFPPQTWESPVFARKYALVICLMTGNFAVYWFKLGDMQLMSWC